MAAAVEEWKRKKESGELEAAPGGGGEDEVVDLYAMPPEMSDADRLEEALQGRRRSEEECRTKRGIPWLLLALWNWQRQIKSHFRPLKVGFFPIDSLYS